MNPPINFERTKHQIALNDWLDNCRLRWARRYPQVNFDAHEWQSLKISNASKVKDARLRPALADFAGKDASFSGGLRCIAAEVVLAESAKSLDVALRAFRLLKDLGGALFDLSLEDLRKIEANQLKHAEENPSSANTVLGDLQTLSRHIDRFVVKGVIPRIVYAVRQDVKAKLLGLCRVHRERARSSKTSMLDYQIEALSEATSALFNGDTRLSASDRVAIAALNLGMCAPSRANEILCLATDDHVTLEDYTARTSGYEQQKLRGAHQMLIITMKGSKGAQWGAKPILNFMIDLFNLCVTIILEHGRRSRMLVTWYQQNPNTLYLPPELEHLRGKDIDRLSLWKIVNLTDLGPKARPGDPSSVVPIFRELRRKGVTKLIENPRSITSDGKKNARHTVQAVAWADLEACLLNRVRSAMDA